MSSKSMPPTNADRDVMSGGPASDLTLLDFFARGAMEMGWRDECERATWEFHEGRMLPTYKGAAQRAYHYAVAMLAERQIRLGK